MRIAVSMGLAALALPAAAQTVAVQSAPTAPDAAQGRLDCRLRAIDLRAFA
jgi:hypothetical protein